MMLQDHPLARLFPGLTILNLQLKADSVMLLACANASSAICPRCSAKSNRIHSYYSRRPTDLPLVGSALRLIIRVRRWRCRNPDCASKTFAEPLPGLLARSAQRTLRLNTTLQHLALALGGEAGARQSKLQSITASPATLLRRTRQIAVPERATPRVLAVDDFAFRKGRTYGTILVDGESHHPVEILPERSAASLADWLKEHPGIEIITRDRATEYARGATDGAPQALQVLDRWHLIGNLQEALARLLERARARLQRRLSNASTVGTTPQLLAPSIYDRELRRGTKDQARAQQTRARRYEIYAQVKALQQQGRNILQIARELELSRQTVRHYMANEHFPEWSAKPRQPSILDPYVAYLQQRWDAGCQANKELYAELQELGFGGSMRPLVQWTMLRRDFAAGGKRKCGRHEARKVEEFVAPLTGPKLAAGAVKLPGTPSLAWLLLGEEASLSAEQKQMLKTLKQDGELSVACELAQTFLRMVRGREPQELAQWLERCARSGMPELRTFAKGLQREAVNVRAALESP